MRRNPLRIHRGARHESTLPLRTRQGFQAYPLTPSQAICHCVTCRHVSGSVFTTNIVVPEGTFKITAGQPKTYGEHGH
jgi:hypothetical protein